MNPSLEVRDLRLVQAIARAGGATAAARVLCISQSAVSHQLRGLEERLGQPLFERGGRKLCITPAGERLVELADQFIGSLVETELEIKRGPQERRKLRLGAQCYTAYHWLPSAVTLLLGEYPELELSILGEAVPDYSEAFREDQLDVCLCVDAAAAARGYTHVKLFDDELVLAMAPAHPLAGRRYVRGSDLGHETLIQPPVSRVERDRVSRSLFSQGGSFGRVTFVPLLDAILELVRAGLGVSILPRFALQPRLQRGEIAAVRLTERGLGRTWSGVFRRHSPLEAPIVALLGTLSSRGQFRPRG